MKKGNYFYTGLMFIGFAVIIFGISYYRYSEQSLYSFIDMDQKINGKVVKQNIKSEKDISYFLSLPFAAIEYGSVDLIYCKPTVSYTNYQDMLASFENPFPVTIPRQLDSLEILYSPTNDREIINDTFYLRGTVWLGGIISSLLLLLGLYSLKM